MEVDITFLGEHGGPGPSWQAQPQDLNSAFGTTQEETREAFVQAWNTYTGQELTQDDFEFTQQGGPPEEALTLPADTDG